MSRRHKSSGKETEKVEAVVYDMTPERKEKFKRVSGQVVDLLRRELTPIEAFAVLQMILEGLRNNYDIRGAIMLDSPTEKIQ
jgi:hypothetical protein